MGIFRFLKRNPKINIKWDAWRFKPCEDISAFELASMMLKFNTTFTTVLHEVSYFPEGKTPEDVFGVAGINRHFIRAPADDHWEDVKANAP